MYRLIRPLLFLAGAETSHRLALAVLSRVPLPATRVPSLPVELMGHSLRNPVGLAAGLDKDGTCIRGLAALGFGFLELGSVTPRAQPGNAPPRLFRLVRQRAIINRMGFNSRGMDHFLTRVCRPHPVPVGVNLGKNRDTPLETAAADYVSGLRAAYGIADYFAINVSSPNTPGLRDLQDTDRLDALLKVLGAERDRLTEQHGRRVPLAVKLSPDLAPGDLQALAQCACHRQVDAVIAVNTTLARPGVAGHRHARQSGGLSGAPLKDLAEQALRVLDATLGGRLPIIAVGGIFSAADAWDRLVAGATTVQIYSALIFEGPGIVKRLVEGLAARVRDSGEPTLAAAVAAARKNVGNESG